MEIANGRLRLNKVGSDVPIKDFTPAEAMLLHILHGPANGGLTFGEEFKHIEVVGTAKVQVKASIPEVREPDFETPAVAEQRIPGKIIKVGVPAVEAKPAIPPVGKPGDPNYEPMVPAVEAKQAIPEVREPDQIVPAKSPQLVRGKVLQVAVPAVLRDRTNAEERRRLASKYQARNKDNKFIIDEVWPDKISPNLPVKFKDIPWASASSANIEAASVNYVTGSVESKQI
jgi:hypothetical protein